MIKVSPNFSREEFACKCGCGFAAVDIDLLETLELTRLHFNSPITINSACRCELHNTAVNGSYGSKHKKGIAADIVVKDASPEDVYKFLDSHMPISGGLGLYETFTHVDVRDKKARWKG